MLKRHMQGDNRMASKASLADQQSQVQENVHAHVKIFAMSMDGILIPDNKRIGDAHELPPQLAAAKILFVIKLFPTLHYELEVV